MINLATRRHDDDTNGTQAGLENFLNKVAAHEVLSCNDHFKLFLQQNDEELKEHQVDEPNVEKFKKAVLLVAGAAVQKLMQSLAKEQEVLMHIADMMIWTYTAESLVLRVQKLAGQRGEDDVAHEMAMMKVYCYEVAERMHSAGKEALLAFAEGDELKGMLMGLKRFTKTEPFNTTAARHEVAVKLIEEGKYRW